MWCSFLSWIVSSWFSVVSKSVKREFKLSVILNSLSCISLSYLYERTSFVLLNKHSIITSLSRMSCFWLDVSSLISSSVQCESIRRIEACSSSSWRQRRFHTCLSKDIRRQHDDQQCDSQCKHYCHATRRSREKGTLCSEVRTQSHTFISRCKLDDSWILIRERWSLTLFIILTLKVFILQGWRMTREQSERVRLMRLSLPHQKLAESSINRTL